MDPVIAVAIFSFLGILATAAAGIVVAVITNKAEKTGAAESTMEKTLRERLTLRDEQLQDIKADLESELAENARLRGIIAELREGRMKTHGP